MGAGVEVHSGQPPPLRWLPMLGSGSVGAEFSLLLDGG